jgi:NAD(P)-dependent dehydrogenase (short-subunit alcohol dehydrogenase family)
MAGKICLVTGATGGIGLVTARALAQMGAHVVVAGRSEQKCEAAVAHIRAETGSDAVEYLLADLSVQAQVRALAGEFLRRHARLDVLVNNAGVYNAKRQESDDGFELTWAVNHLGYFLLTHLLLDALKSSAPSRIVNVASGAHVRGALDFDDLQWQQGYSGFPVYAQSKLANILFTYELARRLDGTGVTANALHPGFVASGFGKNNGFVYRMAMPITALFALSPEEGAQTSIYLASSPEVEGVTGQYFYKCQPFRSSRATYDEAAARRLWEVSAAMTGLPAA